ncbi:MAG: class I SAM-dependent methyltransferase [Chloroflexota bacterium]|nr:class I SAM-dependent methyltransferase [Chloroflexota bacterium]
MSKEYSLLAPVYDTIGLASFAETITPKLLLFAHTNDWVGRRVIEFGCGTGAASVWMANHGHNMIGFDSSPEMIEIARRKVENQGVGLTWRVGDIRSADNIDRVDMILALDVINELPSLRDMEAVFVRAHQLLDPGKLLMFDLHTIEGLIQRSRENAHYLYDDENLIVLANEQFDYERNLIASRYDIFRGKAGNWTRGRMAITRRGYPVQAIAALLQRIGFSIMGLFNINFEPFDPATSHAPRVIYVARKIGGGETP